MVNYSNGKIYKIEPINGEEGDIYIGSTTKKYLSQRMDTHRNNYKQWQKGEYGNTSSFYLFDKYDVINCKIILLKLFSCSSKDELEAEEGQFIRNLQCVNKRIPCRTQQEQHKIYRHNNREIIKEKKAKYYIENKNYILQQEKEYRDNDKEKQKQRKIKYRIENKEMIREKNKKYYLDNKLKILEKQKIYNDSKKLEKSLKEIN
jgi:hypothetical protein